MDYEIENLPDLKDIIRKYEKDDNCLAICRDLEIYIAKKDVAVIQKFKEYYRVFPRNGSHYVDFIEDYGIDERLYVAFKILLENGLINYIEKMQFHEGTLNILPRSIFRNDFVKMEFDRIMHNKLELCGDIWNYEIVEDI